MFYDPIKALPLAQVYGSDGSTLSSNVFVWASDIMVTLEAPQATRAGIVHFGSFPLDSLSSQTATLTYNDLRVNVHESMPLE